MTVLAENKCAIALAMNEFSPELFPVIYVDVAQGSLQKTVMTKLHRDENGLYLYENLKISIPANSRFVIEKFEYWFSRTERASDGTLMYVWVAK